MRNTNSNKRDIGDCDGGLSSWKCTGAKSVKIDCIQLKCMLLIMYYSYVILKLDPVVIKQLTLIVNMTRLISVNFRKSYVPN